jgi:Cellulase (glycosyl hydrolase family 5)
MLNETFQKQLAIGIDVDWCKTTLGREAAIASRDAGINVPSLFKQRGFDHARIRITEDVATDPSLLAEILAIVDDCLAAGLIPILAYQAEDFKNNPLDEDELFAVGKWWETVASTLKDKSLLAFNLIIETTGELLKENPHRLTVLYMECMKTISEVSLGDRILICPPTRISSPWELPNLALPSPVGNCMAEWHFYAAGPSRTNKDKRWTTGTIEERKLVEERINFAKQWSLDRRIPTWVGAWMPAEFNSAESAGFRHPDGAPASESYTVEEQAVFAGFMASSLAGAGIPFAINSDTKYFNRLTNTWYESVAPVLEAIFQGAGG